MKTDHELQSDVQDEIKWEPKLRGAEIGVIASKGVITLTGVVDRYTMKIAAEKAAERVAGVRVIAQEIEVRVTEAAKRSDTDIASAILESFKWNIDIPEETVTIKVENAWVFIDGVVEWQYQKDLIEDAVEPIRGIKGVSNYITIQPKINPGIIQENIRKALQRNAAIEASNVKFEIDDHKVTLKGTVHSWFERNEIEKAAWSAPGVVTVKDDLIVT